MENQLLAVLAALVGFAMLGVFMVRGTLSAVFGWWLVYAGALCILALILGAPFKTFLVLLVAPWMLLSLVALLILFILGA